MPDLRNALKRAGLNNATSRLPLPVIESGLGIPRIIHQTYPRQALPPELEENVRRMRALNPGWEYRLYGDSDIESFINEHYGAEVLGHYQRINPKFGAARADLFRYLLMYKIGGLYLDIKSSVERNLDEVLRPDDCFLLSQWRNGPGEPHEGFGMHADLANIPRGEYLQWFIAATPGHPFLRAVITRVLANIDRYNYGLHGARKHAVLRVTGPIAYTLAINPLLARHSHRVVDHHDDLGIIYSIYDDGDSKFQHRKLFQSHYSRQEEPLVQQRGFNRFVSAAVSLAKQLRRKVRVAPS